MFHKFKRAVVSKAGDLGLNKGTERKVDLDFQNAQFQFMQLCAHLTAVSKKTDKFLASCEDLLDTNSELSQIFDEVFEDDEGSKFKKIVDKNRDTVDQRNKADTMMATVEERVRDPIKALEAAVADIKARIKQRAENDKELYYRQSKVDKLIKKE
jgi:hypothetical protein